MSKMPCHISDGPPSTDDYNEEQWIEMRRHLPREHPHRLPVPDADHPDAMECPMCDNITLVPAEDEHSREWTCTHCGAEVNFP